MILCCIHFAPGHMERKIKKWLYEMENTMEGPRRGQFVKRKRERKKKRNEKWKDLKE